MFFYFLIVFNFVNLLSMQMENEFSDRFIRYTEAKIDLLKSELKLIIDIKHSFYKKIYRSE